MNQPDTTTPLNRDISLKEVAEAIGKGRPGIKGVVNCQNTWDNVVPRMQQWLLDIPQ